MSSALYRSILDQRNDSYNLVSYHQLHRIGFQQYKSQQWPIRKTFPVGLLNELGDVSHHTHCTPFSTPDTKVDHLLMPETFPPLRHLGYIQFDTFLKGRPCVYSH